MNLEEVAGMVFHATVEGHAFNMAAVADSNRHGMVDISFKVLDGLFAGRVVTGQIQYKLNEFVTLYGREFTVNDALVELKGKLLHMQASVIDAHWDNINYSFWMKILDGPLLGRIFLMLVDHMKLKELLDNA